MSGPPRALTVALTLALTLAAAQLGCAAHGEPEAAAHTCDHASLDPDLVRSFQGRWTVAHATSMGGQKPPTRRLVGVLELSDCRYEFVARRDADLDDARRDLPFIDVPKGTYTLTGFGARPPTDERTPLAILRLAARDAPAPLWTVHLHRRVQEPGDHLSLRPTGPVDPLFWEVTRGNWVRRPGDFVPGSDPDSLAPRGPLRHDR